MVSSDAMQKRAGRSRRKQPSDGGSELRTIPEEMLEQQQQNHRVERTPVSRQIGSSVPVSQLFSQEMSSQADDDDPEPNDRIFISQEEQRRFRALLELFRKGKITQHNAFDMPVRVLQPQEMETNNLRMWRVASDMLNVSTNIYDKRIENTYQESSKVHMGINRAEEQTQQKKREEPKLTDRLSLLFSKGISEADRGMVNKIDVGQGTLDDPQRINSNPDEQFSIDPFFQKTRSTFDSSTAKGLLLNCFELAPSLEIRLIASEEQNTLDRRRTFPANFDNIAAVIQQEDKKALSIFGVFTQAQEELIKGFEACGLEEEQDFKKVATRMDAAEISKICQDIHEVSLLDPAPNQQQAFDYPESIDQPQQTNNVESVQSLPEKCTHSLNGSRIVEILSEYDSLSQREHVVGTGKTDYLENFSSPWDIPNPFSKRRKAPSREKQAKKAEKEERKKNEAKQKTLIAFDHRHKIDKGFLRSKSKNRSERVLRTLEELGRFEPEMLIPMTYHQEDLLQLSLKPLPSRKRRPVSIGLGAPKTQQREKMEEDDVSSTNQQEFTFAYDDHRNLESMPYDMQMGPIHEKEEEETVQRETGQPLPLDFETLLSGVPSVSQNYENILNLQPVASQQRQISMKRYKAQLFNSLVEKEKSSLTGLRHQNGVSVQTTFVALLHLANEKTLSFEASALGDDFLITQTKKQFMEHD